MQILRRVRHVGTLIIDRITFIHRRASLRRRRDEDSSGATELSRSSADRMRALTAI
jgi:hypothetical protein